MQRDRRVEEDQRSGTWKSRERARAGLLLAAIVWMAVYKDVSGVFRGGGKDLCPPFAIQKKNCPSMWFIHCVRKKSKPNTMYHRNVKSECIVCKFCMLYSEVFCKICKKILFEIIVWQQSYQSLNIKKNILLFPVQRTAVTQWRFDAII